MEAHHYGLTVSDMAAALEFYRDTLGFPVVYTTELSGEAFGDLVGVPDAAADVVFLDAGGILLELFAFHPTGDRLHEGAQSNDQIGAHHLAFVVDDVDARFEEIRDDVDFLTAPQPGGTGITAAYVYDPDRNVVELVSRDIEAVLDEPS